MSLRHEIWRAAVIAEPTFRREDWTWLGADEPPSVPQIADAIRELLKTLKQRETSSVGGGRLLVQKDGTGISIYLQVGHVLGESEELLEKFTEGVD